MNNEVLKHITFGFIGFNVGIHNKNVSNTKGRTTPIQGPFFALLTNQKMNQSWCGTHNPHEVLSIFRCHGIKDNFK
jgi:hypothetical protein